MRDAPEVFGAEPLLTRRAVSPEVGRKLLDRIAWWHDYVAAGGGYRVTAPGGARAPAAETADGMVRYRVGSGTWSFTR